MHRFQKSNNLILFIVFGFILFLLSNRVDELRVYQGASIAVYVIAISSIILLTGYSGQVSLGHGALLAIGAYSAAVMRNEFNVPIVLCFFIAVLAAAIAEAGLTKHSIENALQEVRPAVSTTGRWEALGN